MSTDYKTVYDDLIKQTGKQELTNSEFSDAVKSTFSNNTDVEPALQKTIAELTDTTNGVNPENDKISKDFFVKKMEEFQQIDDDAIATANATANASANPVPATGANTANAEAYIIVNFDNNAYSVDETNKLSFDDKKFPVKITIVDNCDQSNLTATQKCFEFGSVTYQIDWSNDIKNDTDINTKLLVETFLTPNGNQNAPAGNAQNAPGNQNAPAGNNPAGPTANQNAPAGNVQQIDDDKIREFLSVPENIDCIKELLDVNNLDFDKIMGKIHCIIIICNIKNSSTKDDLIQFIEIPDIDTEFDAKYAEMVKKIIELIKNKNDSILEITSANTKMFYDMQIVLIAIGGENDTMESINAKSEKYNITTPLNPPNAFIQKLNISNPNNSNLSCWLNSILMALLVPKLLSCTTADKVACVKGNLNLQANKEFSDELTKYIDTYFSGPDKHNVEAGKEALQAMKTQLLNNNPAMVNNLNNIDTFLRSDFFSNIFNVKPFETTGSTYEDGTQPPAQEETKPSFNFINLSAIDKLTIDKNIIKTTRTNPKTKDIVNYSYTISTDAVNYIVFVSDVDGKLDQSVQDLFVKKEMVLNSVKYTLKSLVLGSGGHYTALIKNGDEYVKVDDLPNDVNVGIESKEIANIDEIIKKNEKYDGSYACAYIFEKDVASTSSSSSSTSGTAGGSRKNRLQKIKKTKRKYYVYK